ncbi:MAG TPA: OmpA family protein [Myxococcales bacterium]|nr:OmpA family protein [Myxococcales bacterium]
MLSRFLPLCAALLFASAARAQLDTESLKKAARDAGKNAASQSEAKARGAAKKAGSQQLEKQINEKLLDEARKNQCAFKSGSDQFEGNCDDKVQNLFNALVDAKKKLVDAGVSGFKFEVSGHTDTTGKPAANKELSRKRAAKIVKELVKKGIPQKEIIAVGKGSSQPLVKPDDTPEKRAKNRRYEIRVRLLAA